MGKGRKEDYVRVTGSRGDLGRAKSHLKSCPIRGQGWEHVYPHICQSSIRAALGGGEWGGGSSSGNRALWSAGKAGCGREGVAGGGKHTQGQCSLLAWAEGIPKCSSIMKGKNR